jgi:hypothetical protein
MRKAATICAVIAVLASLGIGLYLLVGQPQIEKDWLGVWADEMGMGSAFALPGAATTTGVIALLFAAVVGACGLLIRTRFVAGGMTVVVVDMLACMAIVVSPHPKSGVLVWAVPGLLMAAVGFLLGMHLQRVEKPNGVAEF